MKYATAALAFAVAVAAQEPAFLNTDFTIEEGKPFTLKFSGCETSCTINLKAGPSGDLDTIQPLTSSATGGSAVITLNNLPSDSYAFEIIDNTTHEKNYSSQFDFNGTGEKSSTAEATTKASSTTEAPTSTTEASTTSEEMTTETSTTAEETTTTAESSATTLTTVRSSSASATESATETATSTESESTTAKSTTAPTTVPDGGAGSLASPMSLVMGAVAALLLLH